VKGLGFVIRVYGLGFTVYDVGLGILCVGLTV
jgi:hypothetical protein